MEHSPVGVPLNPRDSLKSDDDDWKLEKGLAQLHKVFQAKVDTLKFCTEKVVEIRSESLTASNVRHSPVTHRVKTWNSAKDSIRRRHQERVLRTGLRDIVVGRNRQWSDYCHESGLDPLEDKMEPFQTPDQMLSALHDFGGVRISLYFPGDGERVAAILDKKFKVIRKSDKAQGSGANAQKLQERISYLQNQAHSNPRVNNTTALSSQDHQRLPRTFTGYKATHFVVRLLEKDILAHRLDIWRGINIEIQVGTLVMHVWSEIEHDLIYKPQELQGEKISDDEERVLDLINGIVLTGEAALRQLEASTLKRQNQRLENEKAMASNHYELAVWVEKHCEAKGISLTGCEWLLLPKLLSVLRATGDHQLSIVKRLVDDTGVSQTASRQTLPILMLQALCKRPDTGDRKLVESYDQTSIAHNARFWALRLVHSLNLAIYLGVSEEFIDLSRSQTWRPCLASFLDILHPNLLRPGSTDTALNIINYCKSMIDSELSEGRARSLLRVAMDLPKANKVVGTAEFDGYRRILVPDIITKLFPVEFPTAQGNPGPLKGTVDNWQLYRILDFIDSWSTRRAESGEDTIISNPVYSKARFNFVYFLGLFNHDPPDVRYFVPRTTPGTTPQDQSVYGWQIIHHTMELDVVKLDMYKETETVYNTCFANQPNVLNDSQDGFMGLAYRLLPEDQWEDVRDFWEKVGYIREALLIAWEARLDYPPGHQGKQPLGGAM